MSLNKSKVSVIGLGYIGLPTAAVLASVGHDVVGVDLSQRVVDVVNRGDVHIVEPDLDGLVRGAVIAGRLRAVTQVESSDTFIIAVPTPFKNANQPDLAYVEAAACAIAPQLRAGNLVILESTSPVGTTEKLAGWLTRERPDLVFPCGPGSSVSGAATDVSLAYCPERVLPGSIVLELVRNDRVIGGLTPACTERAVQLYASFVRGQCVKTDARTAEMTKLTENAFRDVNIAFANELSVICDQLNINVWDLVALANRHPRVNILNPGPGVGGHCIAVDPWFIVDSAPEATRLIRTARQVNDDKPHWVVTKIEQAASEAQARMGRRVTIACMGLAFKANIDDLRESPSLEIVKQVVTKQLAQRILVVEPYIDALPMALAGCSEIKLTDTEQALRDADVVVLLVDHKQFLSVSRSSLAAKVVIDTRGSGR
jgi:UDP-N-acetyl-D-mannosaminuronic acid dehydrogenase